jgi:hypothetical protein
MAHTLAISGDGPVRNRGTVTYLIRDGDAKFPELFDRILTDAGHPDRVERRSDAPHELDHGTVGAGVTS